MLSPDDRFTYELPCDETIALRDRPALICRHGSVGQWRRTREEYAALKDAKDVTQDQFSERLLALLRRFIVGWRNLRSLDDGSPIADCPDAGGNLQPIEDALTLFQLMDLIHDLQHGETMSQIESRREQTMKKKSAQSSQSATASSAATAPQEPAATSPPSQPPSNSPA